MSLKETIKVKSINPADESTLDGLIQKANAVVCDVDYTLLDVGPGHQVGIETLSHKLGQEIGDEVNQMFHLVIEGHRLPENVPWEQRADFNQVMKRMARLQAKIVEPHGLKVWSLATWILIASEQLNKPLTGLQVTAGRDAYWRGRGEGSVIYDDIPPFINYLEKHNKPLFLMTGSYSILQVDQNCQLTYDPEKSRQYKQKSLERLLSFPYAALLIGDPIDKPNPEFFKLLAQVITSKTPADKLDQALVIGDSERNDLQFPRKNWHCFTALINRP